MQVPSHVEYERPATLAAALTLLANGEGEARPLAGGHSLIPMMKLRLARPELLVDINGLTELAYIRQGETVTPSPHHPIGANDAGESATVGSPAAVVNAVLDALKPYGVRHADMPLIPAWRTIKGRPLRTDLATGD